MPQYQLWRSTRLASRATRPQIRHTSTRSRLFTVAEEVQDALATGKPVVALETTIYTHGFPYPENVDLATRLESLVRAYGGVPATIGIVEGRAHVGMSPEVLKSLVSTAGSKDTWKISRRDLGFIGGLGLRGKKLNGGTTIAGTMVLAHLAGIKIFATGGLGGVHKGGENSMDISADLTELGRTPVALVSSGCKSFLDIPRTLEYLETQGVGIGTFADGRKGQVDFPGFFSRDSGVKSPQTITNEADAAAIVHAQFHLPIHSGLILANPVPAEAAMAKEDIDDIIAQAVEEAEQKGYSGSTNTPYILKRIRELSNGASVGANSALIEANVIRGTRVAVELAKLEAEEEKETRGGRSTTTVQISSLKQQDLIIAKQGAMSQEKQTMGEQKAQVDVLVAGSIAYDTICDYAPFQRKSGVSAPVQHTSNPARISQSTGGVGRNVALAAYYAGARTALASVVADDIAGTSLIDQATRSGLDVSHTRQLRVSDGARTAQYVAVNDTNKDLAVAMADMDILTRPELEDIKYWSDAIRSSTPKWIVVDANWSSPVLSAIITAAEMHNIPVAFEPVSVAKAARLFNKLNKSINSTSSIYPQHAINLMTPNILELRALHLSAQEAGLFDSDLWWSTINALNLSSAGSRDKFTKITNSELTDAGVPQQSIQLLPYVPDIVTKLGAKGVLLTSLIPTGDDRLRHPTYAPYILSQSDDENGMVGGVYMRLFPPAEHVLQEQIRSVNGVGDTLLGVLVAGLAKAESRTKIEDLVPQAQEAAVMTLKSEEAVSPAIAERVRSMDGSSAKL